MDLTGPEIIIVTCLMEIFVLFFALIRNEWVLKARLKVFKDSKHENGESIPFDNLVSYDEMLNTKFWCFDVEKFYRRLK